MRAKLLIWAAAMTLALSGVAAAAEPPAADAGPLPVDAFFGEPQIGAPELSPSGRYLAYVRGKPDKGQAVVVRDLDTGVETVITQSSSEKAGFDWIAWKGEGRLMLRLWLHDVVRVNNNPKGRIRGIRYGRYILLIDRDGKRPVAVFQNNPSGVSKSAGRLALLSHLRGDADHVLVKAPDGRGALSVWKVNIHNGVASLVETGDWQTVNWAVDTTGQVIQRTVVRGKGVAFEARGAGGWQEVVRIRLNNIKELSDFEILGPTNRPGQLYVAVKPDDPSQGDNRSVRIYDFVNRTMGAPEWPPLKYDIVGIVYAGASHEMAGVCYVADVLTCDFKDDKVQARYRQLSAHFKQRSLAPVSYSDDMSLWVVAVRGGADPGSYYLFDPAKKQLEPLGEEFPGLPAARLGVMRPFVFKARDGVEIPAYVTRPPGAGKAPLPMVVMPHGGPEARDSLDYDSLAQFLATRGYLVYQPNFRGSGGYGRGYAEAGHRQWGRRMQDDVTDGAKALIASGEADPRRVCIVGFSYGGYAALQAGATEPEMFRCVVSGAGVSDLRHMMNWVKTNDGADGLTYRYWARAIGDPGKDRELLEAPPRSPTPRTIPGRSCCSTASRTTWCPSSSRS